MKSIKYKILSLVIVFAAFSCDDELTKEPFDSISYEGALQSNTDFTVALRGAYAGLRQGGYYAGEYQLRGDIHSDNAIICSEGRNSYQSSHYWTLSGNLTYDRLWDDAYEAILRANLILENIDKLADGDFKDQIEGEARAIRALAHFDLAKAFGETPAQAAGGDMGIPYVTSSDAALKPSRPSVADTWSDIEDDFVTAAALLAGTGHSDIDRLSEASVNALLSRFYLFTEEWTKAEAAATAALAVESDLNDITTFGNLWTDDTDVGRLFNVANTEQDGIGVGVYWSQTGPTGVRSEYVADYAFYSSFDPTDIRLSVYHSTSDFAGKTFNHIAKFFGRTVGSLNVVDGQVIRTAEVYLNRAEARYNKGGDEVNALADLDVLRANRYSSFASGNETGTALRDAIYDERRKELAYEGHRFWDLKRWGMDVNRSTFGDESDGNGTTLPATSLTLLRTDAEFVLPIPQQELNSNSEMEQNPGY